jgi:hypothetical protein
MGNIIDYVADVGRYGFDDRPFGPVDSLILSQLAYLRFDGLLPGPDEGGARPLGEIPDGDGLYRHVWNSRQNRLLLLAAKNSARFGGVALGAYTSEIDAQQETQFAALTFDLGNEMGYAAFRGTDATIIGWKEDFNMVYMNPVPAQVSGIEYLNAAARRHGGKLYTGGHSKGGNIAGYAAIRCDEAVQQRLCGVFNHDGPGFHDEMLIDPGYLRVKDRMHNTLPQASLIGTLLQTHEARRIVRSSQLIGILQHDPFSWQVENGDFKDAKALKSTSAYVDKNLVRWLQTVSGEDKKRFVDTLFTVIGATSAHSFYDMTEDWVKKAVAMINALKGVDPDTKRFMRQTVRSMFAFAARAIMGARKNDSESAL